MPVDIDLDFQRYVERKKGALEAQVREGGAYAYGADVRFKKTLDSVRPVRVAIEAAGRLWRGSARDELLADAKRVSPQVLPRVDAQASAAARALHVTQPPVYVSAQLGDTDAQTLGIDGDLLIVVGQALVDSLSDDELRFVLGRQHGYIQNDQLALTTARYYLAHSMGRFVQWIVTPASAALNAWARRATITADRAGLIAARSLDVAEGALRRIAASDEGEADKRIAALRIFADSAYYKGLTGGEGGFTQAEVDGKVGEVLT